MRRATLALLALALIAATSLPGTGPHRADAQELTITITYNRAADGNANGGIVISNVNGEARIQFLRDGGIASSRAIAAGPCVDPCQPDVQLTGDQAAITWRSGQNRISLTVANLATQDIATPLDIDLPGGAGTPFAAIDGNGTGIVVADSGDAALASFFAYEPSFSGGVRVTSDAPLSQGASQPTVTYDPFADRFIIPSVPGSGSGAPMVDSFFAFGDPGPSVTLGGQNTGLANPRVAVGSDGHVFITYDGVPAGGERGTSGQLFSPDLVPQGDPNLFAPADMFQVRGLDPVNAPLESGGAPRDSFIASGRPTDQAGGGRTGGYLFPVGSVGDQPPSAANGQEIDFFRPLILQFPDDLGRTSVNRIGGTTTYFSDRAQFNVDSFFDVFTEISLDGPTMTPGDIHGSRLPRDPSLESSTMTTPINTILFSGDRPIITFPDSSDRIFNGMPIDCGGGLCIGGPSLGGPNGEGQFFFLDGNTLRGAAPFQTGSIPSASGSGEGSLGLPVVGDFDGDGLSEFGVFQPGGSIDIIESQTTGDFFQQDQTAVRRTVTTAPGITFYTLSGEALPPPDFAPFFPPTPVAGLVPQGSSGVVTVNQDGTFTYTPPAGGSISLPPPTPFNPGLPGFPDDILPRDINPGSQHILQGPFLGVGDAPIAPGSASFGAPAGSSISASSWSTSPLRVAQTAIDRSCRGSCLAIPQYLREEGYESIIWLIGDGAPTSGTHAFSQADPWVDILSGIPHGHLGVTAQLQDIDGDGDVDLAVGVPGDDSRGRVLNTDEAGAIYLIPGPLQSGALEDLYARRITGQAGDRLGSGIGFLDTNGDGILDLIAGAGGTDNGNFVDAGAIKTYLGQRTSVTSITQEDGMITVVGNNLDAYVLVDGSPAPIISATTNRVVALGSGAVVEARGVYASSSRTFAHGVRLFDGWNLVGTSESASVTDAIAPFDDRLSNLFTWNAAAQRFLGFTPGGPAFLNRFADLNAGDGAWVRATGAVTWVQPQFSGARSVALQPGFNLVTWSGPDGAAVANAVSGLGGALEVLFTWDPLAQRFLRYDPSLPASVNQAKALSHGYGVWIRVSQAATWNQPAP